MAGIQKDEVITAARGRWREILTAVGGIEAASLNGKHHPCPKCGGTDRFRLIDAEAGAVLCNQCFDKGNGDGIAAVMWAQGWEFPEALKRIGGYLQVTPATGRAVSTASGAPAKSAKPAKPTGNIVAEYDYKDEDGEVIFQVVRYEPKQFRQRKPDGKGGWSWSVKGLRVVPYRLRELQAEKKRPVFVVEGEKDVHSLEEIGVLATCNAGGAGKWTAEHAEFLRGRTVLVVADNDEAGTDHAEKVAVSLHEVARQFRVIALTGLPTKGDVSDWISAGGTKERLEQIVKAAAIWRPSCPVWPKLFQNLRSSRQTELEEDWPSHVVCAWMGNSRQVAAKHYLQVTEEHYEKAAQNAAQQAPATSGSKSHATKTVASQPIAVQDVASPGDLVHECRVGDAGFEPATSTV